MKTPGALSTRVIAGWIAAAILLAVASVYLSVFGSGPGTTTVGPSAYSRSAIGYAGIADMMRRLGARVVKSRSDSVGKLDAGGVLIVAEPSQRTSSQQLSSLMSAHTVLLVLPKWTGSASTSQPGWLAAVVELPQSVPAAVARDVVPSIEIVRDAPKPQWSRNELHVTPVIADKLQLMKTNRLRPVVASDSGMLIGELRSGRRRIWILSDPDVMSNRGIANSDNAEFAVAMLNALRAADGNVVFDEVVHGFQEQPSSPFRILFEFPFVLATLQGLIAIGLLLWATAPRFGAPLSPPVALRSGKGSLIESTAKLFDRARHRGTIVQRYIHAIVHDVARHLHAPAGLSEAELVEWLRRSARARAVDVDCGAIVSKADELANSRSAGPLAAALARDIFRWKREIIDGSARYSRVDRRHSQRNQQGGGGPG
jgi:hypothetical protein